jgi:hypothetical protein
MVLCPDSETSSRLASRPIEGVKNYKYPFYTAYLDITVWPSNSDHQQLVVDSYVSLTISSLQRGHTFITGDVDIPYVSSNSASFVGAIEVCF